MMADERVVRRRRLRVLSAVLGVALVLIPSCAKSRPPSRGGTGIWHEVSYEATRVV